MEDAIRKGRVNSILEETISLFITENASRDSFITLSYIDINAAGNYVRAYCTVFPKEKERAALNFLKRKEYECKQYIKKRTNLRTIPSVRFFLAQEPRFD